MTQVCRMLLATACLCVLGPAHARGESQASGDAAAARGDYARAARYYRETAAHFRAVGDAHAAFIYERKADQYEPVLLGYRERPAAAGELRRTFTGQKFEPLYGCYIGVNCHDDDSEEVRGCDRLFFDLVGKRHGLVYDYAAYGEATPTLLGQGCAAGPWLQLACEPRDGLAAVRAGAALDDWARALGRNGAPIFLRWASEMNGSWAQDAWRCSDPAVYVAKWRLVHDAMERYAPNVALVWCPSATPGPGLERFYPGDRYVDWVGVNFYVAPIEDNDPRKPSDHNNPADLFKHVYAAYASRKPLMICETGISSRAEALGEPHYAFGTTRLRQLYGSLPRLYPRLKAICYYSVNTLLRFRHGRQSYDYALTSSREMLAAYREAVRPDYFLSAPQDPAQGLPAYVERLADGQTLTGRVALSAWAQAYPLAPVVCYRLDGRLLALSAVPGTYDCVLDCNALPAGRHRLTLTLLERAGGRVLKEVAYRVQTRPAPAAVAPPAPAVAPAGRPSPPGPTARSEPNPADAEL